LIKHGKSIHESQDRLGGDSSLTPEGEDFAKRLGDWLSQKSQELAHEAKISEFIVWTSSLMRDVETATPIKASSKVELKALDDLDYGDCDSLTYYEMAQNYPSEYAARVGDKLRYRFPRGESYEDLIQRIEPLMLELERSKKPVVVIASKTVLRVLYSYFLDLDPHDCPYLSLPSDAVIQITPKAYANEQNIFHLYK